MAGKTGRKLVRNEIGFMVTVIFKIVIDSDDQIEDSAFQYIKYLISKGKRVDPYPSYFEVETLLEDKDKIINNILDYLDNDYAGVFDVRYNGNIPGVTSREEVEGKFLLGEKEAEMIEENDFFYFNENEYCFRGVSEMGRKVIFGFCEYERS